MDLVYQDGLSRATFLNLSPTLCPLFQVSFLSKKINTENIFISLYWTSMYWSLFFQSTFLLLITLCHRYTISVSVSALQWYLCFLHIKRMSFTSPQNQFLPSWQQYHFVENSWSRRSDGRGWGRKENPSLCLNLTSNSSFDIVMTCKVGIIIFILQMIKQLRSHGKTCLRS